MQFFDSYELMYGLWSDQEVNWGFVPDLTARHGCPGTNANATAPPLLWKTRITGGAKIPTAYDTTFLEPWYSPCSPIHVSRKYRCLTMVSYVIRCSTLVYSCTYRSSTSIDNLYSTPLSVSIATRDVLQALYSLVGRHPMIITSTDGDAVLIQMQIHVSIA